MRAYLSVLLSKPVNKTLTGLATLGLACALNTAQAQEATATPSTTPSDAKQQWESLTPAQQAAFKQQAQNQAQEKKSSWDSLTPEEQAAKKAAAKEKAQPYAESAKTSMSARRATMSGSRRRH